jgi:2-hydroxymuconate-semialdehyde hydrolase
VGALDNAMAALESKFVLVGEFRTHYFEGGRGPTVVLLHSGEFGGCAELSWEFTAPALAERFHVLAPDWLGFGESAKIFSFEDMRRLRACHIQEFLRTLCIERAHFIGNSMGGGMLAAAAAQGPPIWPIDRMILASAGGLAPVNEGRKILNSYDGSREHMKRMLETMLLVSPLRSDEAYLEKRHRLSLVPGSWECTAAARFRRPGVTPGGKEEIDYGAIRRPTLIVAGGMDPLREPDYGQALQNEIVGSELVVFEEAGHFPHIDCPERFNRVAIEFLSRR